MDRLAKKARSKVAALRRLRPYLDNDNMKLMYTSFVRSGMEYGNLLYMGAAGSHLQKLDRVQQAAEALGCFTVESLQSRREAVCLSLASKLLSGNGRGSLSNYTPIVGSVVARSRHQSSGIQISMPVVSSARPLDGYSRSFLSKLPDIWASVPRRLVSQCQVVGWCKLPRVIKRFEKAKSKLNHYNQ